MKTHIDPENRAYDVPLWRSLRKGTVIMPNGKIGTVRLGVPDTYFTIPAVGYVNGKRVRGFVSMKYNDTEYSFTVPA